MSEDIAKIETETAAALSEFLHVAPLKKGYIFVLGCSSSEICGSLIGKASNAEVGEAVIRAVLPRLQDVGIYLAAQCCEHLNRALVIEEDAADKYGFEIVSAVPVLKAGGACATAAYHAMRHPVLVESVRAHGGIDIGDTAIAMHIIPVQVPVRLSVKTVGKARVTSLKRRPKFIGGSRTQYE